MNYQRNRSTFKQIILNIFQRPPLRRIGLKLLRNDLEKHLPYFFQPPDKETPYGGYLYETGWLNSFYERENISLKKEPIPWFTYPATLFLKERLNKNMRVFEYGSGNSTLFFAERVQHITAVETDKEWYGKLQPFFKEKNLEIHLHLTKQDKTYCTLIQQEDSMFDIVIIDGFDRVNCAFNCLSKLNKTGVIIFDDSRREQYQSGKDFLVNNNFRELQFWGLQPNGYHLNCTSIFYRTENCLGI